MAVPTPLPPQPDPDRLPEPVVPRPSRRLLLFPVVLVGLGLVSLYAVWQAAPADPGDLTEEEVAMLLQAAPPPRSSGPSATRLSRPWERHLLGWERIPTELLPHPNTVLDIATEPRGAILWVNEERVGRTPLRLTDLRPGLHTVRVARDGFTPFDTLVAVEPGTRYHFHLALHAVAALHAETPPPPQPQHKALASPPPASDLRNPRVGWSDSTASSKAARSRVGWGP